MSLFRIVFIKAFAGEVVSIPRESLRDANNLRQRFYRYRDKVREDATDEFNLLVDHLIFELGSKSLTIKYHNPNAEILENLNDDQDTGASALNPKQ